MPSIPIAIKKFSTIAAGSVVFIIGLGNVAQATTLNFDDLANPGINSQYPYLPVPNGYGGLNWDNFSYLDGKIGGIGYEKGTTSSPNVIFNLSGDPATVTSSGTFDFIGADLTAAFDSQHIFNTDLKVVVQGFLGGVQKTSETVTVYNNAPNKLYNFNFIGIDSLKFTSQPSGAQAQFVLDDFTFSPSPVPEPSEVLGTLAFGILGVGYLIKSQSKKAAI